MATASTVLPLLPISGVLSFIGSKIYDKVIGGKLTRTKLDDHGKKAMIKKWLHSENKEKRESDISQCLEEARACVRKIATIFAYYNNEESTVSKEQPKNLHDFGALCLTFPLPVKHQDELLKCCEQAKCLAEKYFYDKDHTHRRERIEALRISLFCCVLQDVINCQDVVENADVNDVIKAIFFDDQQRKSDHQLIEALKAVCKNSIRVDNKLLELGGDLFELLRIAQEFSKKPFNKMSLPRDFREKYSDVFLKQMAEKQENEKFFNKICVRIAADILRVNYKSKYESENPSYIGYHYIFHITDAFVPLSMKIHNKEVSIAGETSEERYNNTLDEALQLKRSDRKGHLTIITGKAFYGKTALTRKAVCDWASKKRFQNDYDLMLLVPLRYVPEKEKSVAGFEYATILEMTDAWTTKFCDGVELKFLNKLRENKNDEEAKVLIIIDGYDEERNCLCDELDRFLQQNIRPPSFNFDLMVTRRPSKDIHKNLTIKTENVSTVSIDGFTTMEQRREFFKRHLQRQSTKIDTELDKFETVLKKIGKNAFFEELVETPMILLFLTLVCECNDDEMKRIENEGTMATIFDTTIRLGIQRWLKSDTIGDDAKDRVKCFKKGYSGQLTDAIDLAKNWRESKMLQNLAAFAYKNLVSLESKYYFTRKDFTIFNEELSTEAEMDKRFHLEPKLLSKTGLLSEFNKTDITFREAESEFEFVHARFQEFLAALYLIYWAKESSAYVRIDPNSNFMEDFKAVVFDIVMAESPDRLSATLVSYLEKIKIMSIRFQHSEPKQIEEQYKCWRMLASKALNCRTFEIDGMGVKIEFPIGLPKLTSVYMPRHRLTMTNIHFVSETTQVPIHSSMLDCDFIRSSAPSKVCFSNCQFETERFVLTAQKMNNSGRTIPKILSLNLSFESLDQLARTTIVTTNDEKVSLWRGSLFLEFDRLSTNHCIENTGLKKLLSLFRGAYLISLKINENSTCSLSFPFPQHEFACLRYLEIRNFEIEDLLLLRLMDSKSEITPVVSEIEFYNCKFSLADKSSFELMQREFDRVNIRLRFYDCYPDLFGRQNEKFHGLEHLLEAEKEKKREEMEKRREEKRIQLPVHLQIFNTLIPSESDRYETLNKISFLDHDAPLRRFLKDYNSGRIRRRSFHT